MKVAEKGIFIVVIDDDAMVLDIIVEYLESYGLKNVKVFRNSQKALNYIQNPQNPIHLILSDWEMPEVNGLTLLMAVRKNPIRNDLKFVMVTSQQSMERMKISQAAQWSVDAYIVKPFPADILKQKIWQVMGWIEEEK